MVKKKKIRVGSRDSELAVRQTNLVISAIKEHNPDIEVELVTMKTTGDIILDKRLDEIGGKGLFLKELDEALYEKKVDITVHSLKDMPMEIPVDLPILAYFKRGNPFDAIVLPENCKGENPNIQGYITEKTPMGSSSLRRNLQLESLYNKYYCKSVRGNVLTRLKKLENENFGALVLARAGLERLDLEHRIALTFSEKEIIPSACQGILAIQGRSGEDYSYLKYIDDEKSRTEAQIERSFVRELDGSCTSPIGSFAKVDLEKGSFELYGFYADKHSGNKDRGMIEGKLSEYKVLVKKLAKDLKEKVENE